MNAPDKPQDQFPKAAPDEGSYETTAPWPTELRVFKEEGRMEIEFSDGVTHSLPAEYLRVESPSAEVQGHG
ncbi:MAG TPA: gamma-butyrobetaine hydroxylase-like domain-containing protein, partial [Reyranella sp.]